MQTASIRANDCPARQHGPHDGRLPELRMAVAGYPTRVDQQRVRTWAAVA